jgi:hypothetical protein
MFGVAQVFALRALEGDGSVLWHCPWAEPARRHGMGS